MNIWKWILFYVYSGIALQGLCASKGHALVNLHEEIDSSSRDTRAGAHKSLVTVALEIGDTMSNSVMSTIERSYNQEIINLYEQEKAAREAALAQLQPVNKVGS